MKLLICVVCASTADQMAKPKPSCFITCFLLIAMALHTSYAMKPSVPALFFFGASIFDAGTNIFLPNSSGVANFPPYGKTYFHTPTGRFCDGRTIADFLAQAVALPLVKPYLDPQTDHMQGANFASAASGLLDSTLSHVGVVPFKQQIRQFQQLGNSYRDKLGHSAAQRLISKSLFVTSTGGNDISYNYLRNATFQQTVTKTEFISSLLQIYRESIEVLYHAGARKFVVLELGNIGCYPFSRLRVSLQNQTGCLTASNKLALKFNAALSNLLVNLTSELPNASIIYGKNFNILAQLISHGEQYGFVSTINAACGGGPFNALIMCGGNGSSDSPYPSNYLFWDSNHCTEAANHIIFQRFWLGNTSCIEPFNIYDLVFNK